MFSKSSSSKRGNRGPADPAGYRPVYRQETAYVYDPSRDPARTAGYGYNPTHTVLQRDDPNTRRGRSLLHPFGSDTRRRRDRSASSSSSSSSTSSSSSSSSSSASDTYRRRQHRRGPRSSRRRVGPDYDLYHRAPREFTSDTDRRRFVAQEEYERELQERRRRDEIYQGQLEQQQREYLSGHRGGGGGWGAQVAGMANRLKGTITEGAGKTLSRPDWEQRGLRQVGRGEYETNVTARQPVEREYRKSSSRRHGRRGVDSYGAGDYQGYGRDTRYTSGIGSGGYYGNSGQRDAAAYSSPTARGYYYGNDRGGSDPYAYATKGGGMSGYRRHRGERHRGSDRRHRSLSASSSSSSSSSSVSSSDYERGGGRRGGHRNSSGQGGVLSKMLHPKDNVQRIPATRDQGYYDARTMGTGSGAGQVPPPLPPRPNTYRRSSAHY